MLCDIKSVRAELGLTQMELAVLSGVSLPTIQNIEAGKANPSLEILLKALTALGLELSVAPPKFDLEKAQILGVPLASILSKNIFQPSWELLRQEARKWAHYFRNSTFTARESLAVSSLLCALKDHWPSFYKEIECPIFEQLISDSRKDGHCIKIRRIALSNMSKYL